MQRGMTLQQLGEEISQLEQSKRDYVASTPALRASPKRFIEMSNGNGGIQMRPTAIFHRQLADRLKIPKRYYDRIEQEHPALWAETLNTFFTREPEKRLVRTVTDPHVGITKARAFLSDRYRPLDNLMIITSVMPVLGQLQDLEIKSCNLSDTHMHIQAVWPRKSGQIAVGEEVQAGVTISNSEVGLGSVRFELLMYILKCLNGMISAEPIKRYHVGGALAEPEDDGVLEYLETDTIRKKNEVFRLELRDTVNGIFHNGMFEAELEKIRAAKDNKIQRVEKSVDEVTDRYNLQMPEREAVLERLINGGDLSQWGMSQAITNLANDVKEYDRAIELQRVGGQVVDLKPGQWREIAQRG